MEAEKRVVVSDPLDNISGICFLLHEASFGYCLFWLLHL